MKEELTARLADLAKQYQNLEDERQASLQKAELLHEKMLFLSGAYEEIKLLIKKNFPEETPCVPEATSKTN